MGLCKLLMYFWDQRRFTCTFTVFYMPRREPIFSHLCGLKLCTTRKVRLRQSCLEEQGKHASRHVGSTLERLGDIVSRHLSKSLFNSQFLTKTTEETSTIAREKDYRLYRIISEKSLKKQQPSTVAKVGVIALICTVAHYIF